MPSCTRRLNIPLTDLDLTGRCCAASDGWAAAGPGLVPGLEESPGSTGIRCWSTASEGDLRESATEIRPPARLAALVRVKRCGKSAPRPWQQGWHGKPHREQGRIGVAGGSPARDSTAGTFPVPLPGLAARGMPRGMSQRNGRPNLPACRQDGQNPAYRPSDASSRIPYKPNSDDIAPTLQAILRCFYSFCFGGFAGFYPCCPERTHDIPCHPMNDP